MNNNNLKPFKAGSEWTGNKLGKPKGSVGGFKQAKEIINEIMGKEKNIKAFEKEMNRLAQKNIVAFFLKFNPLYEKDLDQNLGGRFIMMWQSNNEQSNNNETDIKG